MPEDRLDRLDKLSYEIARVSVLEACILVAHNQLGEGWAEGSRVAKEWAEQVVRDALARGGGLSKPQENRRYRKTYTRRWKRRPDG